MNPGGTPQNSRGVVSPTQKPKKLLKSLMVSSEQQMGLVSILVLLVLRWDFDTADHSILSDRPEHVTGSRTRLVQASFIRQGPV